MTKPKVKTNIRINDPDAAASHRQKICIARLGGLPNPFNIRGMTMGHASNWIDQLSSQANTSKEYIPVESMNVGGAATRMVPDAVVMDMAGNFTPLVPPPLNTHNAAVRAAKLHDDIVFDICSYLTNSQTPMTIKNISEAFFNDDHRVDTTSLNNALNKAAKNPTSLFFKEIRVFIVTGKLVKPILGKPPVWYVTFFPQAAKALVVKTTGLDPIAKTDTKFDGVSSDIDELLREIESRPGMKKRTARLRDKIETGAVAVGQEKSQIAHDIAELKIQMADMIRLITDKKS